MNINRVVLIVLDSVGIGALPDAALYNDEGANTLGHIAEQYAALELPNLTQLGLGNIDPSNQLAKIKQAKAAYGKAMEQSAGKDTTTGHWEICGLILDKPFPTFPNGFPSSFMQRFEAAIGSPTIGNKTASGTAIINEMGDEHRLSGHPIVYTSADSVFQIAMHESIIPIERQYEICQIARDLLVGDFEVGRVIARPFIGESGAYTRTKNRKDFSVSPPDNLLDAIIKKGQSVDTIGKIVDIFSGKGISSYVKTANNAEGIQRTIEAIQKDSNGLIFTNLVDFDMLFGHRRNVEGYAKCLMEFDLKLPEILSSLKEDDLLIITADHGNDPTAPGTDHTREYVPILHYGAMVQENQNIGVRQSFADMAATIADALAVDLETKGESYLELILKN
jgi:phosphopentomutase